MGLRDKLDKLGEYFCSKGFHKEAYQLAVADNGQHVTNVVCRRCNTSLGQLIQEQDPTQPFQAPYKNERMF